MAMRNSTTWFTVVFSLIAAQASPLAVAEQQARPKAPAGQPAAAGAAKPNSADAAKKAEILQSDRWQKAQFAMNEWLSAQPYYDAKQAAAMRAELRARVDKASAAELQFLLADSEAKIALLNSSAAQETQAWASRYLSILTDKGRAKMLKDMPNIATMTAAQVQQAILKIQLRRENLEQDQADYNRSSTAMPNPWTNTSNSAEQEQYIRDHSDFASSYVSPFRSQPAKKPFADVRTGPDLGYYVTPYGGVGLTYSPNRW